VTELSVKLLLETETLSVRDVVCGGECRHQGPEECAQSTFMVFPYRGVFMRHVGRNAAVAEANQVVFFNAEEGYRISHPVEGGDACLSLGIGEAWLHELTPKSHARDPGGLAFRRQRLRIDPQAQALVALLRHSLTFETAEPLEAEVLALRLVRLTLGERTSRTATASWGRQKLVDRAKLVLAADPARRWTLAEVAAEVGVSPVYLTQVFQQVEGVPLYRYQLRLRLARSLDLITRYTDLTVLALDLGFTSQSHFGAAFKQAYGSTPAQFQRSASRGGPTSRTKTTAPRSSRT
jgi:AraC-like DNA-binding protein